MELRKNIRPPARYALEIEKNTPAPSPARARRRGRGRSRASSRRRSRLSEGQSSHSQNRELQEQNNNPNASPVVDSVQQAESDPPAFPTFTASTPRVEEEEHEVAQDESGDKVPVNEPEKEDGTHEQISGERQSVDGGRNVIGAGVAGNESAGNSFEQTSGFPRHTLIPSTGRPLVLPIRISKGPSPESNQSPSSSLFDPNSCAFLDNTTGQPAPGYLLTSNSPGENSVYDFDFARLAASHKPSNWRNNSNSNTGSIGGSILDSTFSSSNFRSGSNTNPINRTHGPTSLNSGSESIAADSGVPFDFDEEYSFNHRLRNHYDDDGSPQYQGYRTQRDHLNRQNYRSQPSHKPRNILQAIKYDQIHPDPESNSEDEAMTRDDYIIKKLWRERDREEEATLQIDWKASNCDQNPTYRRNAQNEEDAASTPDNIDWGFIMACETSDDEDGNDEEKNAKAMRARKNRTVRLRNRLGPKWEDLTPEHRLRIVDELRGSRPVDVAYDTLGLTDDQRQDVECIRTARAQQEADENERIRMLQQEQLALLMATDHSRHRPSSAHWNALLNTYLYTNLNAPNPDITTPGDIARARRFVENMDLDASFIDDWVDGPTFAEQPAIFQYEQVPSNLAKDKPTTSKPPAFGDRPIAEPRQSLLKKVFGKKNKSQRRESSAKKNNPGLEPAKATPKTGRSKKKVTFADSLKHGESSDPALNESEHELPPLREDNSFPQAQRPLHSSRSKRRHSPEVSKPVKRSVASARPSTSPRLPPIEHWPHSSMLRGKPHVGQLTQSRESLMGSTSSPLMQDTPNIPEFDRAIKDLPSPFKLHLAATARFARQRQKSQLSHGETSQPSDISSLSDNMPQLEEANELTVIASGQRQEAVSATTGSPDLNDVPPDMDNSEAGLVAELGGQFITNSASGSGIDELRDKTATAPPSASISAIQPASLLTSTPANAYSAHQAPDFVMDKPNDDIIVLVPAHTAHKPAAPSAKCKSSSTGRVPGGSSRRSSAATKKVTPEQTESASVTHSKEKTQKGVETNGH